MDECSVRYVSPDEFYYQQQRKKDEAADQHQKPYFVEVDGAQVFTADFVFEQMSAQSRRIGRANSVAFVSIVISVISVVTCIAVLCN